jgi:hypothetical protein
MRVLRLEIKRAALGWLARLCQVPAGCIVHVTRPLAGPLKLAATITSNPLQVKPANLKVFPWLTIAPGSICYP